MDVDPTLLHHQAVTGPDRSFSPFSPLSPLSPFSPFSPFSPDERALLRWVAPRMDDALIEEIAAADYGFDIPGNREGLLELVHSPWLPDELIQDPAEVLALTRWSTPSSERDRLKRLFACTLLVRARTAGGNPVDSLAPLVDSAWELGEPARTAAVPFLVWCRINLPGDWPDDPTGPMFLTLAVLLLAPESPAAPALAARLTEELDAVLADPDLPWRRRPRSPLYIRRDSDSSETRRLWSSLVTRCLLDNPAVTDPRLTALAAILSPGR
ncbi:hypothetical protein Q0Z83_021220 [Actinoplanes sichuanensis]|uniref:Uncharacterized protein n=1 Tax=Actinoplanes sichuanensis TaxID=512349 RepID=A0ABW4AIP8_9ACTN|nr:hypothetical protein [Actinoplanes sichuanensis]BEL03931.1 hypothetical protein Q0Z83_021220 [Actinoplanes sichuanensis]